jgi:hypothetical protein
MDVHTPYRGLWISEQARANQTAVLMLTVAPPAPLDATEPVVRARQLEACGRGREAWERKASSGGTGEEHTNAKKRSAPLIADKQLHFSVPRRIQFGIAARRGDC